MELRGGQGVGRTRNSSLDFLQPIVSARLGVTDRIEIAVPLWITVVLVRYRSGLPLLGVSGGVRYVDWNRFEGYRAGPAADLSVHASSESLAATLVLSARSGLLCSAGCRFAGEFDNAAFGASAVLAARVFDWLVLSLAAGLTWRTYPALALERGETIDLPPVLYLQGAEDLAHPRPHLDRFVAAYRRAGGAVDLELFEGEGQGFIMRKAGSPASNRALEMIIEFVHKQIR